MGFIRRATIGTFTATFIAGTTVVLGGAAPAEAATVSIKLHKAISSLPVASETRSGYQRSKFKLWVDTDHDCQDTRSEVLRQESKLPVTGRCSVVSGKWKSPYDGVTWLQASDLDIDHLVPLAEAWDSGAKKWNAATRKAYANDLGDRRTLVAVTDNVNQAKGDKDPAQWMPTKNRCGYVAQWVAVKIRWSLKVDRAEKNALKAIGNGCKNVTIKVTKAKVVTGSSTTSPKPKPSTPPPSSVYYANCTEAKAAGAAPIFRGEPGYRSALDRDNDGVACET
jgi:hypothetical protein